MSISRIFEIGKRALLSYQAAVHTTSENIANVNREGYTRRRVNLSNLSMGLAGIGRLGIGISAEDITRVQQQLIETQLRKESQLLGKYSSNERILTQIESILAESGGGGLSNILTEFWNAWNDLANDPESQSARAMVRDKGVVLANTFNGIHSDLLNLQQDLRSEISLKVKNINQIAAQISNLNQQIMINPSPDSLDQRDLLLEELSNYLNIEVREKGNGDVTVYSGGFILVSGTHVNELTTQTQQVGEYYEVDVRFKEMAQAPQFNSGELSSLVEIHNRKIPGYLSKLDALARSLAARVNEIHASGYNLNGITGLNFFASDVSGAANIRVNPAIYGDPDLIAASSRVNQEGKGDIALAIFDIQFEQMFGMQTASDFYLSIVSDVGSQLQEAATLNSSHQLIFQQLQNQKESVSGVSLDEEMTRLMQYEQAYQAAARVVNTVDEMVQTLLSMV